ncbi:MFS transporter [Candidatus Woesebacteria bacterium]|nr:MAG: MFS transporter [Candidatus Woesebacteria bacterium]
MKRRHFLILFITVFIDYLSFGIIFPLLPFYIKSYDVSAFTVGAVIASFSLMQFLFSPLWGKLSDVVGRKPIILASLLGTSLSFIMLSFASSIYAILVSRILAGLFTSASLPTTYAYVADSTKQRERVEKFGMLGAAWGLGFVLGPALGGLLSTISPTTPFLVAGFIALVNFIFTIVFLPESKTKSRKLEIKEDGSLFNVIQIVKHLNSKFGLLFIQIFIVSFALSSLETTFPFFVNYRLNVKEANVGYIFTFIGLSVAVTQGFLVGRIVKKYGERSTIIIAQTLMVIAYLLIGFSPNILILLLISAILSVGLALNEPTLASLISRSSREGYGATMGVTWSFDSIARVGGPLLGGLLYAKFDYAIPFIVNSFLIGLSLFLFGCYLRSYEK